MKLSDTLERLVVAWLKKFPSDQPRSALIPLLVRAQEEYGYLTPDLMEALASRLGIAPIAVAEVATFYSMLSLKPTGRYRIDVCTNVSCALRGADDILACLEKKLGIAAGGTTPDGRFTLNSVECLAACVGAPALQINFHYHEQVSVESCQALVDKLP